MKKILWRLGALAAGLLAGAPAAQAQMPTKAAPTVAELKKNLTAISKGDSLNAGDFDDLAKLGDLADRTARQLVTYLKAHELSDDDQAELGLDETDGPPDAARLRVYTFGYSSGGTRGMVHVPVLQWQNAASKRFAYKLGEECAFSKIHRLTSPGRMLYLLLGQETADSYTELSVAYVLELKGDYLLVNNVAFGQGPSLSLGDVEMKFDDGKQLLYLTAVPSEPPPIPREIYLANKAPLSAWAQRGQRAPKAVTLKFSNGRFVRSRQ